MNFKFKHTEKIVGFFVLLAIIVLIAGAVMVAISKQMFVKTYPFKTTLSDASGLSTSTPLFFKGYEIGRVDSFDFNEYNFIDVSLGVYEKYLSKLVKGCAIYRQSNPVTGETSLVLLTPMVAAVQASKGRNRLPDGTEIPSLDTLAGQKLLEDGLVEKSGDSVSLIFDEAKAFFSHLRTEFKLKKDSFRNVFEQMAAFSKSLADNRAIFDYLEQLLNPQNGPVFRTIQRFSNISGRLEKTVIKLEKLMDNYKNPDGLILKMMQLDRKQLQDTIKHINSNLLALQEMLASIKSQSPMIAELMERTRKTLESLNNNPLLRGGISDRTGNGNRTRKKRLDPEEVK